MASSLILRNSAPSLTLDVLKGVHSGVSLPLERGTYLVGSATDCDLTLSDRDVSANHMRLQFAGNEVMIEAIGADLMVDDTNVPVGHGLQVPLPVSVSLGSAHLNLSRPVREPVARAAGSSYGWMLGSVAAFSILTIAAVQAGVAKLDHEPAIARLSENAVTTGAIASQAPSSQEVSAALAAKLREAGLPDLKIEADGTRLSVSGAVDDGARKNWGEVQAWFDRSYGTSFVLNSLVGEAAPRSAPKFHLQAIWFGETPYAIGADGARLYKGAALEDGWYIKDIRDGSLTAARQGEEFVLRF